MPKYCGENRVGRRGPFELGEYHLLEHEFLGRRLDDNIGVFGRPSDRIADRHAVNRRSVRAEEAADVADALRKLVQRGRIRVLNPDVVPSGGKQVGYAMAHQR
jgi:hypothetical protein